MQGREVGVCCEPFAMLSHMPVMVFTLCAQSACGSPFCFLIPALACYHAHHLALLCFPVPQVNTAEFEEPDADGNSDLWSDDDF
jgi:hypothetical protein